MTVPFGHQTVTFVSRSTSSTDDYGNEVFTETTQSVAGCALLPTTSSEKLGDGDLVQDHFSLYVPANVVVQAVDRVVFNGVSYEADGDPMMWPDFRGVPHHQILGLRRVTG